MMNIGCQKIAVTSNEEKKMRGFHLVCAAMAARLCFEGGQCVRTIASSAEVSGSTVRRWIKLAGGKLE